MNCQHNARSTLISSFLYGYNHKIKKADTDKPASACTKQKFDETNEIFLPSSAVGIRIPGHLTALP
jgi:hypothetical protein